jgi:hypothetical protein
MNKPMILASHYSENLTWLVNQSQYDFIVYSKNEAEVSKYGISPERVVLLPNKGKETSSYLKFIIDRYDSLPDHVAFCHGHDTAWHQDRTVLEALQNYRGQEFYTLNNPYYRNLLFEGCPDQIVWDHMKLAWHCIDLPFPSKLEHTMSAQFVAPRESILRNPLSFYQKCYDWMMDQTVLDDLRLGIMFEQLWYYFLTHKTVEPRLCSHTTVEDRGIVCNV